MTTSRRAESTRTWTGTCALAEASARAMSDSEPIMGMTIRYLRGDGLHAPELPPPAPEQDRADDGERREGSGDGDEHAPRAESEVHGERPRERNLPQPEAAQVEPGGRPGVTGTVERLREHHPPGVEYVPVADDPQAHRRHWRDPRVGREQRHNRVREQREYQAHGAEKAHVVNSGNPYGPLGAFRLPGAQPLPDHRRGGIGQAPGRQQREDEDPDADRVSRH